jgi:DNA polymerase-4
VAVTNLDGDDTVQLVLPLERANEHLDMALDDVRERFGSRAVSRAVLLGRRDALEMPLLPD